MLITRQHFILVVSQIEFFFERNILDFSLLLFKYFVVITILQ